MRVALLAVLIVLFVTGALTGHRVSGGHRVGAVVGSILGVLLWCVLLVWIICNTISIGQRTDQQIQRQTEARAKKAVSRAPEAKDASKTRTAESGH